MFLLPCWVYATLHLIFFRERERERVCREGQAQKGEAEKGRERDKNGGVAGFLC